MSAPMWVDVGAVHYNRHTDEIFWWEDCEEVAVEDFFAKSKFPEAHSADSASTAQYVRLLKGSDLTIEREGYLRQQMWWGSNAKFRWGEQTRQQHANFVEWIEKTKSEAPPGIDLDNLDWMLESARLDSEALDEFDSEDNLRQLRALLNDKNEDERFAAAEIHRTLGEHEKSLQLLDFDFSENLSCWVGELREANLKGDTKLLRFTPYWERE